MKTSPDGPVVYIIETPTEVLWSKRKMTAQYRHVDFHWRDKARYKEINEFKFNRLKGGRKPVLEITP